MTLIKSISGIRGTIGGRPGDNLTPVDIVKFTAAFASWIRAGGNDSPGIVIGRDARISGPLVSSLVSDTLRSMGINVRDLGLASTPTVEMAVAGTGADGGIIVTASHNPAQWNALKLLNARGEFIGEAEGEEILRLAAAEDFEFAAAGREGRYVTDDSWNGKHIDQILRLDLVDVKAIEKAGFTVAVDCVNSVGGIIVPQLLKALGIKSVIELNTTPDGIFPHNPEPLPENLGEISALVADRKADLGLVVDPDVDRLAIICEDGSMFGEEYTLVAVADFILRNTPGSTVSNLSSTRALKDVTEQYGCRYFSSPVGEVHVVEEMKARNAVIGGEGNGGIIYPALHYGRDALAGIALFLTHLALSGMKCSELRGTYPSYWIAKKKLELDPQSDLSHILQSVRNHFSGMETDERDGLRIDLPDGWFQLRKSNTEPVMRIYAEGRSEGEARLLAERVISIVKKE
ncbi:MAG TPA: phosphoglucosamine mutase [Bacteroidales bacterium]|jgi:phosphomannomutase|nr:phosphoglucosamine mutase [Bacteroidales bacterium]HQH24034.1 phosphoglucosamine mutase [Bacteroidales bacterium]HQJ82257.1 phosphoglucosamine mutase [Bacteroidales bacterium]